MEKRISVFAIAYFLFGFMFAFCFAYYYKWVIWGYLSPNFWWVSLTWPFQIIGFIKDLLYFGFAGKP